MGRIKNNKVVHESVNKNTNKRIIIKKNNFLIEIKENCSPALKVGIRGQQFI